VAIGLMVGIVAAMHVGKLPPAIPVLRQEFALTLAQSGWVVSAFNTLGLVASIGVGLLGPVWASGAKACWGCYC
jgi:MFS family permease